MMKDLRSLETAGKACYAVLINRNDISHALLIVQYIFDIYHSNRKICFVDATSSTGRLTVTKLSVILMLARPLRGAIFIASQLTACRETDLSSRASSIELPAHSTWPPPLLRLLLQS
jgi:hypothetical protein